MITFIQAGLIIDNDHGSAARVTEYLGTLPDEQFEKGDLKGAGPHTFAVSMWTLFSMNHLEEIRKEFGSDPWGRVLWIIRQLGSTPSKGFEQLRAEGYNLSLYASLVTDHPENTFELPREVLTAVAATSLDLDLSPISSVMQDVSHSELW